MKRSPIQRNVPLSPGSKPLQRSSELKRTKGLSRGDDAHTPSAVTSGRDTGTSGGIGAVGGSAPPRGSTLKRGKGFAASPAQRAKARTEPCVVTGFMADESYVIDPAHLCARGNGGCDDPLCVIPLWRPHHRAFDDGIFDILPYLVGTRTAELCHALEHYEGDLLGLLHRLCGERYVPAREAGRDGVLCPAGHGGSCCGDPEACRAALGGAA